MSPPPDPARLHRLFIDYCDGTLGEVDFAELGAALADPEARRQFREFCQQAVTAADLASVVPSSPNLSPQPMFSRRQALAVGLAGLAVGAGAMVAVSLWGEASVRPYRAVIESVSGMVLLRSQLVSVGSMLLVGDSLSVVGSASSVTLRGSDGSKVYVVGDTAITLERHRQPCFVVHNGSLSAELTANVSDHAALVSQEARVVADTGPQSHLTFGRSEGQTKIGVIQGSARVVPTNGQTVQIGSGEVGTITHTQVRKSNRVLPPANYSWDLEANPPAAWEAGHLEQTPTGPVLVATRFEDSPGQRNWMVRSESQWLGGLATLYPDSVVRVRCRVRKSGVLVFYAVTRPDPPSGIEHEVVSHGRWAAAEPDRSWKEYTFRFAEDGHAGLNRPTRFAPPWVAFVMTVTTPDGKDLGLEVAGLSIGRS